MTLPLPLDYCLILLNLPISPKQDLNEIIGKSKLFICSDGGLNRLRDYDQNVASIHACPHYIIGDMDSISESSRKWLNDKFGENCCSIIKIEEQDTTDFEKALRFATLQLNTRCIVAMNCFSGRLDHTLSSLNSLGNFTDARIVLLNESCVAEIVRQNDFEFVPECNVSCGILPLFGPVNLKTSGLQYEVDGILQFGGLISSSNSAFQGQSVRIKNFSSIPYIWTVNTE